MNELVTRVDNVCYRGYKPKVSSLMDPTMVQIGNSFAFSMNLPTVPRKLALANGSPYTGHNGKDTVGRWNEPIYAIPCPESRVKELYTNTTTRGNWLEYGNNRATVRQCHFATLSVELGQVVSDDTIIGIEGSTGDVTGKHLHTSILIDGKYVDPYYYMTGQLQLPGPRVDKQDNANKAADGFYNWPNTDQWEKVITPRRFRVNTPGNVHLRVRERPGTDKIIVMMLPNQSIVYVDRWAELPDKQIWARLYEKPWHWICLERGITFVDELEPWPDKLPAGAYYFVRSSWENRESQIGAFNVLSNARRAAAGANLKVFDPEGREVVTWSL